MATPTEKMLLLPKLLKTEGSIHYEYEFYDAIGVDRSNLDKYRKGTIEFSMDHLKKACLLFNIDANYILGITDRIHYKKPTEYPYIKKYIKPYKNQF